MNKIIFILPLAIIFVVVITNINWRQLIKAVLLVIIIDGALRKWFLPQASNLIYLFKDFILIIAYIKYFFLSHKKQPLINDFWVTLVHILIGLCSTWLLFQSFNPDLGSPIIGLFGLSRYLLNVPLIWIVPYLFDTEEDLYRFLRNYLLVLIPVCILGIFQFFSPASSFINIAPGGEEASEVVGFGTMENARIRISSVFSFTNIYTTYLSVKFGLLLPFFTVKQSVRWQIIIYIELFLMISNFFMTGARGVFLFALVLFVVYFGIKSFSTLKTVVKFLKKLILPAFISTILLIQWFAPAIDAFSTRVNDPGSSSDIFVRVGRAISIQSVPGKYFLDGYGTGSTQSGGKALQRVLKLPEGLPTPEVEEEINRIAVEISQFGAILWYAMRIALLITLWSIYRNLKSNFLKDLALVTFLIHAILLPSQVVVHPVANVYYWFLSGFIFLLPRLESKRYYNQYL
ncbi:hypothetical protein [Nostoc sp. CCY0012]|uniref:hypothetical protein n=1 Tax=Nostoc sp. CCY0012 TaxID=1056123 RepID=UPI0039C6FE94